jgi:hypothetical protein
VNEIETEALTIAQQAQAIAIIDQPSYDRAAEMLKGVTLVLDKIDKTIDPEIDRWNKGHKAAIALKRQLQGALPAAKESLKYGIAKWDVEQQRLHREAEMKAQAEARRLAAEQEAARQEQERQRLAAEAARDQEARLNLAIHAEDMGAPAETVTEIMETPILETQARPQTPAPVPVPVMQPRYKPAAGVSTAQRWRAEVVDLKELCRAVAAGLASIEYIQANLTALNQSARALKSTLNVPGVKAVPETSVTVRR